MFEVHPLPAFNDNYIWVLSRPGSKGVAVIDPGDAAPVARYLSAKGLTLEAILVTHHHPDHTGGVEELAAASGAAVYGPAGSPFTRLDQSLSDGQQIQILGQPLEIKAVPGHTLDHISYFHPDHPSQLFCGDTLFLAGCGRLFEGTARQMHEAMAWFRALPDDTQVYAAHEYSLANLAFAEAVEPANADIQAAIARCREQRNQEQPTLPGTIGEEKRINPYMRTDQPAVMAAAARLCGHPLDDEAQVLAQIRQWKDRF